MSAHANPPLTDKDEILGCIAAIEADIPVVDTQIAAAELLLASLHQQRDSITQRANEYRKLLTYIQKLPVEILGHIFRIYQASGPYFGMDDIAPRPSPWLLRGVCKHWSAVADDIPEFWMKVELKYPSSTLEHAATTQMRQIKPHFPAQVTISNNRSSETQCPLPTVLRRFSAGIDSLTLHGIDPAHWASLLEHAPGGGARLDKLLTFCASDAHDGSTRYEGARPQDITNFFHPSLSPFNLPWSQLTCISVDLGMTIDTASRLLPACRSLIECSIVLTGPDANDWSGFGRPTNLKSLRKIKLTVRSYLQYSHVFDVLTLPALKILDIVLPYQPTDNLINEHDIDGPFIDLKRRSSLDLEEFSVSLAHYTSAALATFLQDMPSLYKIYLHWSQSLINRELMNALTVRPGQATRLAPNLVDFGFDIWEEYYDVSFGSIIDMVESRAPPPGGPRDTRGESLAPGYLQTAFLRFNGYADYDLWDDNLDIQRRITVLRQKGIRM